MTQVDEKLATLLQQLSLSDDTSVEIEGADPVIPSRFRIGQAAATALAGCGVAANELWQLAGGSDQRIQVDVAGACISLIGFMCQRLEDNSQPVRDPNRPLVGFYQAKDGRWIHIHGAFPSLAQGTLEVLACKEDPADIARAIGQWEGLALEDALADAGMCGAMARSRDEWLAHEQGKAMCEVAPVTIRKIGDSEAMPLPAIQRPLQNIRVLDLTRVLAGPTCGRTLASHGANVLKINSPNLPSVPPFVMDTGHGKRSAYLDLEQSADVKRLEQLIQTTDIFSQGYRKGALDRKGLSADALAEKRPGIIYVSINAYGHVGPWSHRPGWEQLAQTATGIAIDEGSYEQPRLIGAAATDYTTGYLAACGAMAALVQRAIHGGSYHVEVSLVQTANWLYSFGSLANHGEPKVFDLESATPYMTTSQSGFGQLHHLNPILTMSATPPRWEQVSVPLGTHAPAW